jgi:hypothetical protein
VHPRKFVQKQIEKQKEDHEEKKILKKRGRNGGDSPLAHSVRAAGWITGGHGE